MGFEQKQNSVASDLKKTSKMNEKSQHDSTYRMTSPFPSGTSSVTVGRTDGTARMLFQDLTGVSAACQEHGPPFSPEQQKVCRFDGWMLLNASELRNHGVLWRNHWE